MREIEGCDDGETNPIDVIVRVLVNLTKNIHSESDVASGLDAFKGDILDPELNKIAKEYFGLRRNHIIGLLKRLDSCQNVERLAKLIDSSWQGTIMLWAIDPSQSLLQELEENLRYLLGLPR